VKIVLWRPALALAAVLVSMGALLGTGAGQAHASNTFDLCGLTNPNCLNDWNGGGVGNGIRMFHSGASNEAFEEIGVPRCGDGRVKTGCPFANSDFNTRYNGDQIVQITYNQEPFPTYGTPGLCVATDTGGLAVLGACNTSSQGTGGANGTIFIDNNGFEINLYQTNHQNTGNAMCMEPIGGSGAGSVVDLRWPTADHCEIWHSV
jgi:hypothetical protein